MDDTEILPMTLETLRADASGALVQQLATLAYRAFRQPPWRDDLELPRLHFGLGVDLMRRSALALVAKSRSSGRIVGYILGYEVLRSSADPRDLTLAELSGTEALDGLFDEGRRVFYGDTLCVDHNHQGLGIGQMLSVALIEKLRTLGFSYRIGRTSQSAAIMRNLYQKLGFEELPVHDTVYPDRTYWLLRL